LSVVQPVQNFALFPTALVAPGVGGSPLGEWEAIGTTPGDATGGTLALTLILPTGYLFSLEGWMFHATLGVITNFQIAWRTDFTPDGQSWIVVSEAETGGTVIAVPPRDSRLHFPLATGRPRIGGVNTITMLASSNTDGAIYRANVWGHYWDHRAIFAPGGLVRPS